MITKPAALTWGVDCLGADAFRLPSGIPAIWPYITGTPDVVWDEREIARIGAKHVYRINQGYNSPSDLYGDEFDLEAGAYTLGAVVDLTRRRRQHSWSTRWYVTWTSYGQVKGELADAGIDQSVFYHIADWNLTQHYADLELHGDVFAGQWASPTTNPSTTLPGYGYTLAELGADLNVLLPVDTGWQG